MSKPALIRTLTTACLGIAVAFAVFASTSLSIAQVQNDKPSPDSRRPNPAPKSQTDKAPEPNAKAAPADAKAKRPQLGKIIPDAPADRAKLLDDLYAHLATAPDEQSAKPYAETIEKIWLTSGSDTIAALMERAMHAVTHQRSDLGLQLLSAVVDLAPDYAEGWNRRAYVFYTEGDYERALGDLRRVLALDPNHYKALDGLGQIMRQLDRKQQALQAYEKLLAVHPFWPNVQTVVMNCAAMLKGAGCNRWDFQFAVRFG